MRTIKICFIPSIIYTTLMITQLNLARYYIASRDGDNGSRTAISRVGTEEQSAGPRYRDCWERSYRGQDGDIAGMASDIVDRMAGMFRSLIGRTTESGVGQTQIPVPLLQDCLSGLAPPQDMARLA